MTIRRRAEPAVLAAALALAACAEATAPERADAYAFDTQAPGLFFHWPPERLPVRYWIDTGAGRVAGDLAQGLVAWERLFLYGEFRATVVSDSGRADVVVRVLGGTPPDVPLTNDPPVAACGGVTRFDAPDADNRLPGPFLVELIWDPRYGPTDIANCLARVAVHEVGHTIGIFAHSLEPLDLMHANPTVGAPSVRDRMTAEVLYHTPVTVLPPERPR